MTRATEPNPTSDIAADAGAKPARVLVLAPGRVGDLLMLTPSLEVLRSNAPDAYVCVLTKASCTEILSGNPAVDEVLTYEQRDRWYSPRRVLLNLALRRRRFEVAFLFNNNERVRQFVRHCGIGTVHTASTRWVGHRVEHNVRQMNAFGYPGQAIGLRFAVPPEAMARVRRELEIAGYRGGLLVGVHVGCRSVARHGGHEDQRAWAPERTVELADRLVGSAGAQVVLTGTGQEAELARSIREAAKHPLIDLSGRTGLHELGALARLCDVYVTPDTGAMHVAASQGARLVAMFGQTDPGFCGPFMDEASRVIIRRDSFDEISVETVWEAIWQIAPPGCRVGVPEGGVPASD